MCPNSPTVKAKKEISHFFANNSSRFLPKMKSHRTLGVVDKIGQPNELMSELGPVREKGDDFFVFVSGNTRLHKSCGLY